MISTEASLRTMLGGLKSVTSDRVVQALNSAQRAVIRDGIAVSADEFEDLQNYYAASLLEASGVEIGALASKSVADVSVSFAGGSTVQTWRDVYIVERNKIIGFARRVL